MQGVRNLLLASVLGAMLGAPAAAQKVPPSETLLPATTQSWISTPDFQVMWAHWNKTQLGKLMDDPIMEPLAESLDQQVRDRRKKDGTNIGLIWGDLVQMAGSEACLALVHPEGRKPSRVALLDVTGRLEQTRAVMKRLRGNLIQQKAKRTQKQVGNVTVNVYTKDGKVRVVDFLTGNFLCAGGDEAVVIDVLNRYLKKGDGNHLASLTSFQQVKARLEADQPKSAPHVRWFVQPIGFSDAQRALNPRDAEAEGIDLLAVAKKVGFKALMGAGGYVRFAEAKYDLYQRIAVYAPGPWTQSMNMLSTANEGGLKATENTWIPASLATHATCNLELLKAFDHYGPFFDEIFGSNPGAWQQVLRQIASPLGAGVEVRKEIIQRLVTKKNGRFVGRCILATDNRRPVSTTSERELTAVKIYPSAADYVTLGKGPNGGPCTPDNATPDQHERAMKVAEDEFRDVMKRYYRQEVRDGLTKYHENVVPGIDMWERFPQGDDEEDEEKQPVALKVEAGGKEKEVPAPIVVEPESEAFCVTQGHYISATHKSLMLKVLRHIHSGGLPLAVDVDYRTVMDHIDEELQQRKWPRASARRFSRTDEEFFITYELARAGRLKDSDSTIAGLLRKVVEGGGDLDFRKLPSYGKVRPYFKPSGLVVRSETNGEAGVKGWNGWFAVGFTLKQ